MPFLPWWANSPDTGSQGKSLLPQFACSGYLTTAVRKVTTISPDVSPSLSLTMVDKENHLSVRKCEICTFKVSRKGTPEPTQTLYDHINRTKPTRTWCCCGQAAHLSQCRFLGNDSRKSMKNSWEMMQYNPRRICNPVGIYTFRRILSPCQEGMLQLSFIIVVSIF